jgi:hypothetical protein
LKKEAKQCAQLLLSLTERFMGAGASTKHKPRSILGAKRGYHAGEDESSKPQMQASKKGMTDLGDFQRDFGGTGPAQKQPVEQPTDIAGDLLKNYSNNLKAQQKGKQRSEIKKIHIKNQTAANKYLILPGAAATTLPSQLVTESGADNTDCKSDDQNKLVGDSITDILRGKGISSLSQQSLSSLSNNYNNLDDSFDNSFG